MAEDKAQTLTLHPLRNKLYSLQSAGPLTDLRAEDVMASEDTTSSYSKSRSIRRVEKAIKKMKQKREITKNKVRAIKDKETISYLRERMMVFVKKQMEEEEADKDSKSGKRRKRRSTSFWDFGADSEKGGNGQLIDLKTMDEGVWGTDSTLNDGEEGQEGGGRLQRQYINQLFLKPWVLNPHHFWRRSWDIMIVLTALIYTAIRVPYAIAFDLDEFAQLNVWFWLNRMVDVVFISDMVMIFLTGKKSGRKLVTNHAIIAKHYLKTWFILDFLASVPLDLIIWIGTGAEIGGSSSSGDYSRTAKMIRTMKIFRVIRILRLVKIKRIILQIEIFFGLNFSVMSISKFFVALLLLSHLIACGYLGISNGQRGGRDDGWLGIQGVGEEKNTGYIASVYWTLATITTIGYGDLFAITTTERLYSVLAQLIGAFTWTYSVTRIVHILTTMNRSGRDLTDRLETIKEWAMYHDFPEELINSIKRYIHYRASRSYFNETGVFEGLSLSLRRRVLQQIYGSAMQKVELFTRCSDDFLAELMLKMKAEYCAPYSVIIPQGAIGEKMFIIRKGCCAVYRGFTLKDIKSAVILGPGQAFGEIALLAENVTRTANVVALEWTDLAYITKHDFQELISSFPREQFKIYKYGESKIKNWKLIKTREFERLRKQSKSKERDKKASDIEEEEEEELKRGDGHQPVVRSKGDRKRSQSMDSVKSNKSSVSSTDAGSTSSPRAANTKSVSEDIRRFTSSVRTIGSVNDYIDTSEVELVDNTMTRKSMDAVRSSLRNPARPRGRSSSVTQEDAAEWRKLLEDESNEERSDDDKEEKYGRDDAMDSVQKWLKKGQGDQVLNRMKFLKVKIHKLQMSWFAHLVMTKNMTEKIEISGNEKVDSNLKKNIARRMTKQVAEMGDPE